MEKPRILLVEAAEFTLELEKSFFTGTDVELLVARSGEEALAVAREKSPALVFMDHFISGRQGHSYCRMMKDDPLLYPVPIVMVTLDEEPLLAQCRTSGCATILCKPLRRGAFLLAANNHVQLRERAAPRVEVGFRLEYTYCGEQVSESRVVNLSSGGVYIETSHLLPPGTPLRLRFCLPNAAKDIVTHAQVTWVNGAHNPLKPSLPLGMGLQFLGLSLEDMWAVREFLLNALGGICLETAGGNMAKVA